MAELMTRAEIEARFPNEWVLVINPDVGPDQVVRSGTLLAHSKDRSEINRLAIDSPARHIAVWFNGDPIPAGMKVWL
jgi:hypothetical protein